MKIKSNRFLIAIMGTWFASLSTSAIASLEPYTDAEWALLPRYCPHTMPFKGHTPANIAKWTAIMGSSFFHMHHYCRGLIAFRRAERANISKSDKSFLHQRALDEFSYVAKNAEDDFILLPEVLTWLGRAAILERKVNIADTAFNRARNIKPDYWPSYYHWADFLASNQQKAEAMTIVKLGLQHSPNAKALHELFRSLGGRPGEIPPPIDKKPEVDIPATPSPEQPENPSVTIPEAEGNN